MVVLGAGNSAGQAAILLSNSANHVHLVARGDNLADSMSDYLILRLLGSPHITIHMRTEICGVVSGDAIQTVHLKKRDTGDITEQDAQHLFVMIGADPNTEWLQGVVELDTAGFVKTGDYNWDRLSRFGSSRAGVYAVGDVRSGSLKRVASAVGEGSAVISEVHRFLQQVSTC